MRRIPSSYWLRFNKNLTNSSTHPKIHMMTDDKITLRQLLGKDSAASFLREMSGFAAERLIQLETDELCDAGPSERNETRRN